ncbi:ATP-binding protein [Paenibacillus sp. CFBP 13594]|uniref:ATP-binding protein n=1 Tax=Paenibacillus sp. CFBP 13594 TaxID=2774037 RepID=UPI001785A8B5|nr:ATP-binding protein [Paenibacillus sp. CFBP 13594]MBD8836855.1 ATP-binding protein [Paenibacillus sp. CFBP 13594]
MKKIQISTKGIKKSLKKYTYLQSISEYIWNGFDAKATIIELQTFQNELGSINEIQIIDNGYGIKIQDLEGKFTPFFESDKSIDPNLRLRNMLSATHGKNGIGRLTFHRFCSEAEWITVYKDESVKRKYSIHIKENSLDTYNVTNPNIVEENIGTCVILRGIYETSIDISEIKRFLCREFGWYLELYSGQGYKIKLNGETLDYNNIIGEIEFDTFEFPQIDSSFSVKYVRWNERLNHEYSKYYFIDSNNNERHKINTKFNNKGDSFYHSIYIQSHIFDDFSFDDIQDGQQVIFGYNTESDEYKFMIERLNEYLREKRKPFLIKYTDVVIQDFKTVNAFPEYGGNPWDEVRKEELENLIRELYQVEPKIFVKLNVEQKKTFVRFLDLIMDAGEREKLFDVLNGIVELDSTERKELSDMLKTNHLSNVIKTIRLVQDRFKAINYLQEMVFRKDLRANEVDHLQKFIEKHYWIFGEQYHLVTAAEPKFEEALRRYVHLLTKVEIEGKIDHPDKLREMDIFMVRVEKQVERISNIVVELKHPSISLGKKQYDQVINYLQVILNQQEFNSSQMQWEFLLVGNKFDQTGYIEQLLENAANHGERSKGLVFKTGKFKVYIKTWADIFTEFEIRHKYLDDKLQLERAKLNDRLDQVGQIIEIQDENTAIMPDQYVIPQK